MRVRRKARPKDGGTQVRVLGMPTIRDRVVQGALKLILEPICAADCQPGSSGYRPKRSAHAAGERVAEAMVSWKTRVLDVDLQGYFDLREALAVLHVTINEEKSRMVDLAHGETFSCLGCDFRRVKSRRGVWRPWYTPRLKKRTALRRKLKEIFRRDASQPVERVVALINPIVRGWGRSFAVGDSSRCFGCIKDWVEKKVRRHLRRARNRKGLGWKRWRRQWF